MIATAFLHVRSEEIAMDDAAINDRSRFGFILLCPISTDQVPASLGDEAICTRDRRLPVFVSGEMAVDLGSSVEPVKRADDAPEADKDIGCHGWSPLCIFELLIDCNDDLNEIGSESEYL